VLKRHAETSIEQHENRGFFGSEAVQILPQLHLEGQRALNIGGDDFWVDVALAADGGSISETRGHVLDDFLDVSFRARLAFDSLEFLQ